MSEDRPVILSVAGYDPVAGAGLLADVKTIEAFNAYGMGVMTALTYQHESYCAGYDWLEVEQLIRQLDVLYQRYRFSAVKIGMIHYPEMFAEVMRWIQVHAPGIPIVWDPVLGASRGESFHKELPRNSFWSQFTLLTPNLNEALHMFGTNKLAILQQQVRHGELPSVLLKGGHSESEMITDYLIEKDGVTAFDGVRYPGQQKHGSGCVLSAAIASLLGRGVELKEACRQGKRYMNNFLVSHSGLLGYHIYQKYDG